MPTYKLSYFNGRGRGETARILFASAGVKFEDHRIEMADWPKIKPSNYLSLADIYTFTLLQPLLDDSAKAAAFKDHGAIKEHVKRIGAVPAIKKYLDSRPNTFF
ncbi:PREDICTED: hematopoietic prostaglandin D synthase-like [Priapulus caudatus]|uniref:Hematopoietic prostaglandin D synthase-like n=1 Tax=Priapulus caudatus TaxID=37621 RepID=A0ABM1F4C8_PRICU|nr:PREDICTED: hematopoietic prostaglandin D synthase-like [Priapulus caudatus]